MVHFFIKYWVTLATSFFAWALGWTLTFSGWIFWASWTSKVLVGSSLELLRNGSALFGAKTWLVLYLPYAFLGSVGPSWLYRFPGSSLMGAFLGTFGYGVFMLQQFCWIGTYTQPYEVCLKFLFSGHNWWFLLYGCSVGAIAGVTFPLLKQGLQSLQRGPKIRWSLVALIIVPVCIWFVMKVFWPYFERLSPAFAYSFTTREGQQRIFSDVLTSIRIGDSLESLVRRLPQQFSSTYRGMEGNVGRRKYFIRFKNGLVTDVKIDPPYEELPRPTPHHVTYVFPEGFLGWATICYEIPGESPLPLTDGQMIINFPPSGLLLTSSPQNEGWHQDSYRYEGAQGSQPFPIRHGAQQIKVAAQQSVISHPYPIGAPSWSVHQQLFVGTDAQLKKRSNANQFVSRCPVASLKNRPKDDPIRKINRKPLEIE